MTELPKHQEIHPHNPQVEAMLSQLRLPHQDLTHDLRTIDLVAVPLVLGVSGVWEAISQIQKHTKETAGNIFDDYDNSRQVIYQGNPDKDTEPEFSELQGKPIMLADFAAIKYMALTESATGSETISERALKGADAIIDHAEDLSRQGHTRLLQGVAQASLDALRGVIVAEEAQEMGQSLVNKSKATEAHQHVEGFLAKVDALEHHAGGVVGKVLEGAEKLASDIPVVSELIKTGKSVRQALQENVAETASYLLAGVDTYIGTGHVQNTDVLIGQLQILADAADVDLTGVENRDLARALAVRFCRRYAAEIYGGDQHPFFREMREFARIAATFDAHQDMEHSVLYSSGALRLSQSSAEIPTKSEPHAE